MPTLNINGRKVTVGDEFLKLSPDEQNSTVDEIAHSIGYAPTQPAVQPEQSEFLSGAIGFTRGLEGGWTDELAGLAAASGMPVGTPPLFTAPVGLYRKLTGAAGAEDAYRKERDRFRSAQEAARQAHPYISTGAEFGGAIGSMFAPTKVIGLGATLRGQIGRGAAIGGLLGGFEGAGETKEAGDIPTGAGIGTFAGGVTGGALPIAAKGIGRLISPFRVSAGREKAASILGSEGVDLTAGQQTGNRALRYFESEMGGGAAKDFAERQSAQYTKAALKRAGSTATYAEPEIIDQAFRRQGAEFNRFSQTYNVNPDLELFERLGKVRTAYNDIVAPQARAPIVDKTIRGIAHFIAKNEEIPGQAYQQMRSELGKAGMAARGRSPELSRALFGIQSSLDDAMGRSIDPAEQAAWKKLRQQYGNLLVVANAATGAGEKTAEGSIAPAQLRRVLVGKDRIGYARGRGDLAELARAGNAAMTPMPDSGTAARLAAKGLVSATFGAVGQHEGGLEGGAAGATLGFIGPRLAARAILSPIGRRMLANQVGTRAYRPILQYGQYALQPARERLAAPSDTQ